MSIASDVVMQQRKWVGLAPEAGRKDRSSATDAVQCTAITVIKQASGMSSRVSASIRRGGGASLLQARSPKPAILCSVVGWVVDRWIVGPESRTAVAIGSPTAAPRPLHMYTTSGGCGAPGLQACTSLSDEGNEAGLTRVRVRSGGGRFVLRGPAQIVALCKLLTWCR